MLRCSICRQKKSPWKKMKTHFMARHSKLVCQVMKLFSKTNLTTLTNQMIKPFLTRLSNCKRRKKIIRKDRPLSDLFSVTNASRTPSPSKEVPQVDGDSSFGATKDELKLNEEAENIINKNLADKIGKQRSRKNSTKESQPTQETDADNLQECKRKCDQSAINPNKQPQEKNIDIATAQIPIEPVATYLQISRKIHKEHIKKSESDTESCSDNGRNILFQNPDYGFYCNICGNGYNSEKKLINHLQIHAVGLKLERPEFPYMNRDYHNINTFKVYACYVCTSEFLHKKALFDHLNVHYEYEILESVLDMERDYNIPKTFPHPHPTNLKHMGNLDYKSSIKYITQYLLTNTKEQYYCNNNNYSSHNRYNCYNNGVNANYYMKIVCDYCFQELHTVDYQNHLIYAHNVVNNF